MYSVNYHPEYVLEDTPRIGGRDVLSALHALSRTLLKQETQSRNGLEVLSLRLGPRM